MSSNLIKTDETYRSWIREVSSRFRRSQIKAAVKVNDEMLRFYWSLGRDLSEKKSVAGIGNDFYQMVSKDLQNLLPDVKSFSPTNLKYMQYFYELYSSPQVVDSAEKSPMHMKSAWKNPMHMKNAWEKPDTHEKCTEKARCT